MINKSVRRPDISHVMDTFDTIKANLEPELAMFNRTPIPINFTGNVTHLKVCSGFLVYIMETRDTKVVRRVNMMSKTEERDEIDLGRDDDVSQIFMDPSGDHVIISMKSETNYYLHRLAKTVKHLSRFHGKNITAVAWNSEATLRSTGAILIGTRKGRVYETCLNASEDAKFRIASSSAEQYIKQLYDIGNIMVSGITFGRITTGQKRVQSQKFFVLLVTPGRLYQFCGAVSSTIEGNSLFLPIFEQYKDVQDIQYIDLPGDSGISELHTFQKSIDEPITSFAWMASPGVFCGKIDHTVSTGTDSIILNHKLIQYEKGKPIDTGDIPNSIVLSEFHVLMLFKNRLKVVCTLNEAQIWEDTFDNKDQVQGMWRDPRKGFIWINARKGVYKYKVIDEARNVWKILLDMGEYDRARSHCQSNPEKLDLISRRQADSLFKQGKFDDSAQYYAQTMMSFEEVALKFIETKNDVALRVYLEKKLKSYKPAEDKVQVTMLVTWLVEIWLNQLGKLNDQMESDGKNQFYQEKEIMQEEFRLFLASGSIREILREHKTLIYDLISSHGDVEDMVFFADLMQDHEKVISHMLQNNQFEEAIRKLENVAEPRLVYKFSPQLMQYVPTLTVDMWKLLCTPDNTRSQARPPLDPKRLIPSLVQYDVKPPLPEGQQHEAIRFLEFCIRALKNKDQAIHNYLISLYTEFNQENLLRYLKVQGQEADSVNYDLKYALRLCSDKRLDKACVHIYSTMGLYSEAVNLALAVDLNLAQENAEKPDDYDERKKLWLDVARHVVEKQGNIDSAMQVLKDCELLKIEDILPFFPDFVRIDKFKEAITKSLAEYNEHINSLKDDMEEATMSADQIRKQIQDFRKRSGSVRTTDKCSICGFPLVTRSFYLFPCQHKFHSDCLIAEVLPSMSPNMRHKVEELQRRVASREDTYSVTSVSSTSLTQMTTKAELDDLVAAECLYCGEQIIRSVDEPFITSDEYNDTVDSWS